MILVIRASKAISQQAPLPPRWNSGAARRRAHRARHACMPLMCLFACTAKQTNARAAGAAGAALRAAMPAQPGARGMTEDTRCRVAWRQMNGGVDAVGAGVSRSSNVGGQRTAALAPRPPAGPHRPPRPGTNPCVRPCGRARGGGMGLLPVRGALVSRRSSYPPSRPAGQPPQPGPAPPCGGGRLPAAVHSTLGTPSCVAGPGAGQMRVEELARMTRWHGSEAWGQRHTPRCSPLPALDYHH